MESSRFFALLGAALLLLAGIRGQEEGELQSRGLDLYSTMEDTSHEKELIEALQEVLEKLKSKRLPHYEKKYGQVPMCDAGEQCAVRKGSRIGKLCDCPRGTSCNTFLLKCL
ncbi:PREDICTED: cocaine- and amphetamine-regulated transcript protein [Thamnophis sirtalis]|uniref:Cocaine- and amphetamine-regulated transcript protein n=1 Tax=Thamnophis sirtalis TaxID=35019 RepID=A0A6I9Y9L2_9SAUR|nr:PREDICTED: cocaine- and amphetamine-regulated transcript protein [Thamnophis sirtalis]XP_032068462.1 cocaine- and amphetamine-regulated transcript protein [Thamnophis elegans]